MNQNVRKHCYAALLCLAIGCLILMYYRITRYGFLYIDWYFIRKAILAGFALFVGLEVMRVICKKTILPHIIKQQYVKAYAVVLLLSYLLSLAFVLVYHYLRYGVLICEIQTLGKAVLLCLGLFILFCIETRIVGKMFGKEMKGFRFNCSELTVSFICITAIAFSFIPVMSDYINQKYPLGYNVSTIVSKRNVTANYGIVGEITKDRRISQTFLCSSNGLYSIKLEGATYMRTNTGTLTIDLVDMESKETIEQWNLDASKFLDNSPFTVKTEQPLTRLDMKGRRYRIDIYSENASPGNALTLYYLRTNYYHNGDFLIDGELMDGDLDITISGINGPANYERVRIVFCILLATATEMLLLLFFRHRYSHKIESRDDIV